MPNYKAICGDNQLKYLRNVDRITLDRSTRRPMMSGREESIGMWVRRFALPEHLQAPCQLTDADPEQIWGHIYILLPGKYIFPY